MKTALSEEKVKVFNIVRDYFIKRRIGYLKVPTGWGKTFLTLFLINYYYNEGKKLLFLVSRNNPLLKQTERKISNLNFNFKNKMTISSDYEHTFELLSKLLQTNEGSIIFASLQSLLSKEEYFTSVTKNIEFVFIDEVHNFIQNKGNEFIDSLNKNAKILGLTATPYQGVLGNLKVVSEISQDMREIFSKSLPQCIVEGQLAEIKYTIINTRSSIFELYSLKEDFSAIKKNDLYMDISSYEKALMAFQRSLMIKQVFEKYISPQESKTLIFCSPVHKVAIDDYSKKEVAIHAKITSAVLNNEMNEYSLNNVVFDNYNEKGELKDVGYISSDLSKDEKEDLLKAFKNLTTPPYTLCTVGMLIEGYDFPELDNLILLRPTKSIRLYEQQIGRVLRVPQINPQKIAKIIEIRDDYYSLIDEFGDIVFNEGYIDNITQLDPYVRLESIILEEDLDIGQISDKIFISELTFNSSKKVFEETSRTIPFLKMRIEYTNRLLRIIDEVKEGELNKQRYQMFKFTSKYNISTSKDIELIKQLLLKIDLFSQIAEKDTSLSKNCRKSKLSLLNDLKNFIVLKVLTQIKYNDDLSTQEKEGMIEELDLKSDSTDIDKLRKKVLVQCCGKTVVAIKASLNRIRKFSNRKKIFGQDTKPLLHKETKRTKLLTELFCAYCFIKDDAAIARNIEILEARGLLRSMVM
ncbi:MAG: DEAD/DEAH box helicase family protein [Candidatus Heimdallarchaeota archaeon]|nr:MAG: DEAD/DEAH box helicase family protein [Candidatus Heimdallarchaeota archaeon]